MSQPAANVTLSHLRPAVRDELLDWVLEFDRDWRDGSVSDCLGSLPASLQEWKSVALVELVRVDLAKQWRRGSRRLLESYLDEFPELGTRGTVAVELIVAELEARRAAGFAMPAFELDERFPAQAAAVRELSAGGSLLAADFSAESKLPAVAGRDKASLAPGKTFVVAAGHGGVLQPGQPFGPGGRYHIVRPLGRGGMGAVYQARDTELGDRNVAIKVPRFSTADGPELLQRFRREASLLASISHPNLGQVYTVHECDGVTFLVMEYISGMELAEYLKSRPRLTPAKSVWIVRKVAQVLQATHARDVVHRDLKPQNIMLTRSGQPKLIDFGLAVNLGGNASRATVEGTTMGTLQYMPLEQVNGELSRIGPRSDIYSLGVVLYELLTGTVPFNGKTPLAIALQLSRETPLSPIVHNPDVSQRLAEIVLKAIAREPEDRYASMAEFARALTDYSKTASEADVEIEFESADVDAESSGSTQDALLDGSTVVLSSRALTTVTRIEPQRRTRHRLVWSIALAVVGLVVVSGLMSAFSTPDEAPVSNKAGVGSNGDVSGGESASDVEAASAVNGASESPAVAMSSADSTTTLAEEAASDTESVDEDPGPVFPRGVAGAIEGESLRVVSVSKGKAEPQHMWWFSRTERWSNDMQMFWTQGEPGACLTLEFPVSGDGRYEVFAALTKAPDYAAVRLSLDGVSLGEPLDMHFGHVAASGPLSLGIHQLTDGNHELSVTITSAQQDAATQALHGFGLDYLYLARRK